MMQIQKKGNQIQALYEPVKFVYSQTIGLSTSGNYANDADPYSWTYEDILQPKPLINNKVYYYLFHIAPIYNWLRKQSANILQLYIDRQNVLKSNGKQVKNKLGFDFQRDIDGYIKQWQIVKLCSTSKIKIHGTIANKLDKKSLIVNNKLPQIKSHKRQQPPKKTNQLQQQQKCVHLIKKQVFSNKYTLFTKGQNLYNLQCNQYFCQQCQKPISIKCEILKYPFAPYFKRYYGKQFQIEFKNQKVKYNVFIIYTSSVVYVKTSSGVWYEIDDSKATMVSFQKINIKNGVYFVYQKQMGSSNHILRKAQPIKVQMANVRQTVQQSSQQSYQEEVKPKYQKPTVNNTTKINENQNPTDAIEQQKLQQLIKNPLPFVLNKKKTDHKIYKEYKRAIQATLPKQKQKDQYEKDYDKGKTKKIHKNRQKQTTANFFQLYKNIKQNPQMIKKEDKTENKQKQNLQDEQFKFRVNKKDRKRFDKNRNFHRKDNKNNFKKDNKHNKFKKNNKSN